MRRRGDIPDAALLVGMAVVGAVQMALNLRKTYRLIVHRVGWYD